jgi:hypothetical protein
VKTFDELIAGYHNPTLAVGMLANLFREGINDTVHLPEAHSEAAEITHHYLGCTFWSALLLLADLINDARTEDADDDVVGYLEVIYQDHLVGHASHVIHHRGPIGGHTCEMGQA